jgi:hypothetical protein
MPAVKNLTEKFIFNAQPEMLNEVRLVAKVKGMSVSAFIREAILRSLRYYNQVEKPVYESFHRKASEAEPPTPFFSSAFGTGSLEDRNEWII